MTNAEPADYAETLDAMTAQVRSARFTLQRRANAELVALYWRIGAMILEKQRESGWGTGVVSRLAEDLAAAFPTMTGFSRSNLYSMRSFALVWPERRGIVQQPVGQLPWGHIVQLLERLDDQELREWYAGKDIARTWSRAQLVESIAAKLHESDAEAPGNFAAALARIDSPLAHELSRYSDTAGFLAVGAD
jgi:predicted nuclease of restriction endonuclease-like (RecB) superfamily